jgi:hypothetical protein
MLPNVAPNHTSSGALCAVTVTGHWALGRRRATAAHYALRTTLAVVTDLDYTPGVDILGKFTAQRFKASCPCLPRHLIGVGRLFRGCGCCCCARWRLRCDARRRAAAAAAPPP